MLVTVIGGTGFVGSHVVRKLIADGRKVRCTVRNESAAGKLKEMGAETMLADAADRDSLIKALAGSDAAINLVGIIREYPKKGNHLRGAASSGREEFRPGGERGRRRQNHPHERPRHGAECKIRLSQNKISRRAGRDRFRRDIHNIPSISPDGSRGRVHKHDVRPDRQGAHYARVRNGQIQNAAHGCG